MPRDLRLDLASVPGRRAWRAAVARGKRGVAHCQGVLGTIAMSEIGRSTVAILIGNSDNKLSQQYWHRYCSEIKKKIEGACVDMYFSGGSDWNAPWQNACWVVLVENREIESLCSKIEDVRRNYLQDSVAVIVGQTRMV